MRKLSCHDKSGIPDEVLQSILDQYSKSESQKGDPFSITDFHTSGGHSELVQEEDLSPGTQISDKASMVQEYSKHLQQAFEKFTNAGFALGHGFQFVSLSSPLHKHTLFPEKDKHNISFGVWFRPVCYLSVAIFVTPSQELDDLIDSQKNLETSSAVQSSSQKLTSQKEQQKKLSDPISGVSQPGSSSERCRD
ncbi:Zinc finger protein 281 [Camelus dromedarius]|uniref:Zinc finger protein 281 n=1 Tax=Camelus dromedarius TaxID=9838 RepID=A0A5N4C0A7_CAMDR|nr:Zinc finger protein 281 [Camelus dromedarius]